jgi:hypothetical protein
MRSEEVRHGGSMMTDHADRTVVDLEEGMLIECGSWKTGMRRQMKKVLARGREIYCRGC